MSLIEIVPYTQKIEYLLYIARYIAQGVMSTLLCSLSAIVFGIFISICLTILKYTNNTCFVFFVKVYISIIRGTPFFLQLFFVYFALPGLVNVHVSMIFACILTLSINSSAYVSEIIRGGIESVDKGQVDAAKMLSISYYDTMIDIVLPQSLKSIIPSLINEIINLVKESAVVGVIGIADIMRRAHIISVEKYDFVTPLCIAGLFYYILIFIIAQIGIIIEKKLK